jgi:PAS domain S-box-containing protein
MAIQKDRDPVIKEYKRLLHLSGLVLIPVFLLATVVLVALNLPHSYEPPLLLGMLNTIFLGVIPLIIAYIAMRVFLKSGSASVFLLGSGVLIFGLGSIAAGWVNPLTGGPNMTVTIHNSCALISSIFLLAGAFTSNFTVKPGMGRGSTATIAAAYTGIVVFVSIFCLMTLQGMTPPFFIPGSGPTLLRQLILENAVVFFAISSMLFMLAYRKRKSDFFFWTAIALSLITIGLLAVFLQPSVGSPIGWLGRSAQYLGFVLALYAVLNARKAAKVKGLTLEEIVANFFGDAGDSYRQLVETATDAIVTIDDDDRIILWNSAAERIFGFSRDEAAGSSFTGLIIPGDSKEDIKREEWQGNNKGGIVPQPVEITGRRKNGESFPIEMTCSHRLQQGRSICTYIIRDITWRKLTEKQLAHIASFPRLTPVLIAEVDNKGSILFENPAIRQSLESIGETDARVFFPPDIIGRLNGTAITEASYETRDICIHNRYFRVIVIFTPEFESVRIYGRDITEQHHTEEALKQSYENLEMQVRERTAQLTGVNRNLLDEIEVRMRAEQDLKESEEKYRILLDESSDPIFSFFPDGTYSYVNRAFAEGVGKPVGEISGKKIWDVFPKEEAEKRFSALRTVFSTGEGKVIEVRVPRPDGDRYYVTTIVPIKNDDGTVISAICSSKEITERRQMEEELRETSARLAFALRSAKAGTWDWDFSTGRLLWSPEFFELFGFPRDARPSFDTWLAALHPDDRTPAMEKIDKSVKDHHDLWNEYRILLPDGEYRWIGASGRTSYSDTGKPLRMSGVCLDITERKMTEKTIRESRELFATAFYSGPLLLTISEIDTGRYLEVNDTFTRVSGYSSEEAIGKTSIELGWISPRDREGLMQELKITGQVPGKELRLTRKNGEQVWSLYYGKIITISGEQRLLSLAEDITERKLAEEALHEAHLRTATILENIADTYYSLDNNWRFTLVNPAAEKAPFGRPANELLGRVIWDVYPDLVGTDIYQHYLNAAKNYTLEHYEGHSPLNGRWYEVFMQGWRGGVDVYMRDITERKVAEEQLRRAFEEREVLIREVHHRVKNNLSSIISLIDLQTARLDDPVVVSQMRDLETRIRSMALVHESLMVSEDLSRINVVPYIDNLLRYLSDAHGSPSGIRYRIEIEDVTMPIGTAIPCGLVMSEIITNSLKYAFPVTFSCREIRGEVCTVTISLKRENREYLLNIADNGVGMPGGIESGVTGTLGLYLIKLIVMHQLRGNLSVEATGGTSYMIRFPEPEVEEPDTDE